MAFLLTSDTTQLNDVSIMVLSSVIRISKVQSMPLVTLKKSMAQTMASTAYYATTLISVMITGQTVRTFLYTVEPAFVSHMVKS